MDNEEMKKVTGHGGRACLVTYSLLHGVTSAAIMQQTGHASMQSMQPYARNSVESEKVMQDVLAGVFVKKKKAASLIRNAGPEEKVSQNAKTGLDLSSDEDRPAPKKKKCGEKKVEVIAVEDSSSSGEDVEIKMEDEGIGGEEESKEVKRITNLEESMERLRALVDSQQKETSEIIGKLDQVLAARSAATGINPPPRNFVAQPSIPSYQPFGNVPHHFELNQRAIPGHNTGVLAPTEGNYPYLTGHVPQPPFPMRPAYNMPLYMPANTGLADSSSLVNSVAARSNVFQGTQESDRGRNSDHSASGWCSSM